MRAIGDFLTLHRDPARHRFFASSPKAAPFFDPHLKSWIVTDPGHCRELVGSHKLLPDGYEASHQALAGRFGLDFSSITFALEQIPLAQHGERHLRSRRLLGEFLASRRNALSEAIPLILEKRLAPLREPGEVELMQEMVIPLVHDVICVAIGIELGEPQLYDNVSLVFDKMSSVSRRQRIAADVATLRSAIVDALGSKASEDDVAARLALVVLGRDSLIGTLGESLHFLFDINAGRPLRDIVFSGMPPQTGVPVVSRLVATAFHYAGCDFAAGDHLRIHLQTFAYSDDERERATFFGAGAHACLGRPLSLEVWKALAAELTSIPLRVRVLAYEARTTDYIFSCPQRVTVEMLP